MVISTLGLFFVTLLLYYVAILTLGTLLIFKGKKARQSLH